MSIANPLQTGRWHADRIVPSHPPKMRIIP